MNINFLDTKSDLSVPIIRNNSPLTPLLPMERSSFDFSPNAIARCLNRSSTTPKCMKANVSASLENRRSFSPFLYAHEVSFGSISPIEGTHENENISYYKVPANSPAAGIMMNAAAAAGTKPNVMLSGTNNGTSAIQGRIPQIRFQNANSSRLERRLCIESVLKEVCMDHLVDIFAKEEIDLPVFLAMTEDEFKMIGISDADLPILLSAVEEYS